MPKTKPKSKAEPTQRYQRCLRNAQAILQVAAEEWSRGDARMPTAAGVLETILDLFVDEKFHKRA